jgi:hypothetical protein
MKESREARMNRYRSMIGIFSIAVAMTSLAGCGLAETGAAGAASAAASAEAAKEAKAKQEEVLKQIAAAEKKAADQREAAEAAAQ